MRAVIDQYLPLILFGVPLLAILVFLISAGFLKKRNRTRAFQELSGRLGLSLEEDTRTEAKKIGSLFQAFLRPDNVEISNLMKGELDRQTVVMVFDNSQYIHNMGDLKQTMVLFQDPGLSFPRFELSPRKKRLGLNTQSIQRLGVRGKSAVSGFREVEITADQGMQNNYKLRGMDAEKVRGYFTGIRTDFFSTNQGWTVEGNQEWLLVYQHGRLVKPGNLPEFLEQSRNILAGFRT